MFRAVIRNRNGLPKVIRGFITEILKKPKAQFWYITVVVNFVRNLK
jgi:hypothetical protein